MSHMPGEHAEDPAEVSIRTISDEEGAEWCAAFWSGYLNRSWPAQLESCFKAVPLQYSWATIADGKIIATLRMLPTTLTLPGPSEVPCGAVGYGAVLPGFQRRGYYRDLMSHVLRWGKEHDLAIAVAIFADERPYRSLGWGILARLCAFHIDTERALLNLAAGDNVRQLTEEEFLRCAPGAFRRISQRRSGTVPRTPVYFEGLALPMHAGPGRTQRYVIASGNGEISGYAVYDAERVWSDRHEPVFKVTVVELIAETTDAEVTLLAYLTRLSLVREVIVEYRTTDDHLPLLFQDQRGIAMVPYVECLGGRVIDVPLLLSSRRYLNDGALAIEVTDRLHIAGGTFRLEVTSSGAVCTQTTGVPQVQIDITDLPALAVDGRSAAALARAGRLRALTGDAVELCSRIFWWPEAPWSPTHII